VGLEEEIKQKRPFDNDLEKVIVNVIYTNAWIDENLKNHFKPFDLTPKQYNILRILNGASQPLTTSEVRSRMLNKMSDITRLIDRLIRKNYVVKEVRVNDKRLVDITITDDGVKLLETMRNNSVTNTVGSLSVKDSNELNRLLDKLRERQ